MFLSSRAFPPILFAALFLCIGLAHGIRCYKCGQYNEGVGSITPCINYTAHMHLKECPSSAKWCIILEKNEFSNTIQYNREYVMENLSDYHE
ncbi:hypothetical protein APICC_10013 [Apis cerana cerana]|uniref:Protein quiver n=1 Tax=Apis cerana cerana TaxID=94128 RepID=A0A2A3EDD8_APICC|nr:hypothetical protein APICC_10013 [Apis cerana cerana]